MRSIETLAILTGVTVTVLLMSLWINTSGALHSFFLDSLHPGVVLAMRMQGLGRPAAYAAIFLGNSLVYTAAAWVVFRSVSFFWSRFGSKITAK
jgi:hypothetical protein